MSSDIVVNSNTSPEQIIDILLSNRQIKDKSFFLKPPTPSLDLDLTTSLKVIKNAIKNNQNILIYGDYDVDGVTATAILWQALYKLTKNVIPFVPNRERDGYGIKAESFFRFQSEKKLKFDLLITVDNGIVAQKEIKKILDKQKLKIIITDHHLPNEDSKLLTRNCELIHSTQVSGSAISYFLSKELDKDADLGLAALGTVADCLPLVGINRSIVVCGLKSLNSNPSPGVRKLVQVSRVHNPISAYDLGFILGPRINAAGRLSDPTDALRLLCSQSSLQASKYAAILNSYNQDRQQLQKDSLDTVEKLISEKLDSDRLIFIHGDYNPGIIGLIAGRLTEKYYLPTIVVSVEGDVAKGSCRSIPELNIIEALRQHQDLFIDLGGHPGAAGFSIKTINIEKLEKQIIKSVNLKLEKVKLEPHLDIDAQMALDAVTIKNIKVIESLAPFGIGNPEPLFLFKQVTIHSLRTIGQNNDHLKLKLSNLDAIGFKKGDLAGKLKVGDTVDLIASLSINEWNNIQSPQLIIKEIVV